MDVLDTSDAGGQLFDDMVESLLMGSRYGQEFHAYSVRPCPTNRCVTDRNREGFTRRLNRQLDLHASERANDALNSTAFDRQVPERSVVAESISLDQRTGDRYGEPGKFADDHVGPSEM